MQHCQLTKQNDCDKIYTPIKERKQIMEEQTIKSAVEEIKSSNEEQLQKVIEQWFESTRTSGMRIGARYIAAGIYGIIQKHTMKAGKTSLRDYERCIADIIKVIDVQLKTQQNDSEEVANDGTTEKLG